MKHEIQQGKNIMDAVKVYFSHLSVSSTLIDTKPSPQETQVPHVVWSSLPNSTESMLPPEPVVTFN